MKSFFLLKLPLILAGLVAALAFSPACKAQSEVNPDHFDGTDSWQTAVAHQPAAPRPNVAKTPVLTQQAQNKKSASGASVQLAAARQVSQAARPEAVALQDKRKADNRKPNHQ